MSAITTKQFVWSSCLSAAGLLLWILPGDILWNFAGGLWVVATLVLMSPAERSRPLKGGSLAWVAAFLLLLMIAVLTLQRWGSPSWEAPVMAVIRHPLVIVPFWAITEFFTYQRWRYAKPRSHVGS